MARADGLLQACRRGAQDAVTGGVAKRIVDVLEPVEVEEQQRQLLALAARADDRARQPFREQGPVREVGQGIEAGQVAQLLLGAFLVGDVVEHQHVQGIAAAVVVPDRAAFVRAQEFVAVLALLPQLAGPAPLVAQLAADFRVVGSGVLRAVHQAGVAAHHFGGGVAGDALEGRVDRDEIEVLVQHADGLGHAAQHFAGDPPFVLGVAAVGDVARGPGDPPRPPGLVALDHAPARADPDPSAVVAGDAMFGQEQGRLPADMLEQAFADQRLVVRMDPVLRLQAGFHGDVRCLAHVLGGADALQLPALQVVVPELLAGGPQGELEAVLAIPQVRQVASLESPAPAPGPPGTQARKDREQQVGRARQRMAPGGRGNFQRDAQLVPVPGAVIVRRLGAECVAAGREQGVGDVAAVAVVDPVVVDAVDPVAVPDAVVAQVVECADAQPQQRGAFGKRDALHPPRRLRQRRGALSVPDLQRQQAQRWLGIAFLEAGRVEDVDPAEATERQVAVAQPGDRAAIELEVLQPVGQAECLQAAGCTVGARRVAHEAAVGPEPDGTAVVAGQAEHHR